MRYMGGKSRIAKQIAAVIDEHRQPGQLVWDAFCGGLSVSVALSKKGPVLATDACLPLISMYEALHDGWDPPAQISREEYEVAKSLPDTDPLKAFCAFGCSYGGKWFGGYAEDRNGTRNRDGVPSNYALSTRRRLLKEIFTIHQVAHIDFLSCPPEPTPAILYCDPPYAGTTRYNSVNSFDSSKFIDAVKGWSEYTDVFVSEYDFPIGKIVWKGTSTTTLAKSHIKATERLYHIPRGSL